MLASSISILRPVAGSMTNRTSRVESAHKLKTPIKGIKNFSATYGINQDHPKNNSNPRSNEISSRLNQFNKPAKREIFSSPHTTRRAKN